MPVLRFFLVLGLLLSGSVLAQPLQLVATTASMGVIARAVAGDEAQLQVLVPADRDAHALHARPGMIASLRRADMLLSVGAQLEEGWLPAALDAAANPRLRVGQPAHFVAADALHLRGTRFDPALGGHVHGQGNPHFNLSPQRMGEVATAFAERLAVLRPAQAPAFRQRASGFAEQLQGHSAQVAQRLASQHQALAYHEEFDYFTEWLPVALIGFVEQRPGVPPGPAHLNGLIKSHQGASGVVLMANYQPRAAAQRVAEALGWPLRVLPLEPARAEPEAYLALLELWAAALAE